MRPQPLTSVNLPGLCDAALFAPIRSLMLRLDPGRLPDADRLNMLLSSLGRRLESAGEKPVRFVEPSEAQGGYEQAVYAEGKVATRPDDWHDFFNALVWMRFPLVKRELNRRHRRGAMSQQSVGASGRGPLRDAATLFDESGVIVASSDPALSELLRRHAWRELFWARRDEVVRKMRFLVVGHATYDQLRAPFFGLCAKAVFCGVDRRFLDLDPDRQAEQMDVALSAAWAREDTFLSPRAFAPLPLLGIPGVTPDNECEAYYLDARQFRPPADCRIRSAVEFSREVRQAAAGRVPRLEESPGPAEQDAG